MYLKTKSGREVYLPTEEEGIQIDKGIAADPDTYELSDEAIANMKPYAELKAELDQRKEGTYLGTKHGIDIYTQIQEELAKKLVESMANYEFTDEERVSMADSIINGLRAELVQKNKGGRPKADVTKEHLNIRLSKEVVETFRATGNGWQTRIDEALKEWLKEHPQ